MNGRIKLSNANKRWNLSYLWLMKKVIITSKRQRLCSSLLFFFKDSCLYSEIQVLGTPLLDLLPIITCISDTQYWGTRQVLVWPSTYSCVLFSHPSTTWPTHTGDPSTWRSAFEMLLIMSSRYWGTVQVLVGPSTFSCVLFSHPSTT